MRNHVKIEQARQLRKNLTPAEKQLWHWLRRRHLNFFRFRRQVPLGKYIVDFLCHEVKLIIEVDGGGHNCEPILQYDQQRSNWLKAHGYLVKRYWNHEVFNHIDDVLEDILRVCQSRLPPS